MSVESGRRPRKPAASGALPSNLWKGWVVVIFRSPGSYLYNIGKFTMDLLDKKQTLALRKRFWHTFSTLSELTVSE